MTENKIKPEKAFWQFCRECGCQYLEPISWVTGTNNTTMCPNCGHKLSIL